MVLHDCLRMLAVKLFLSLSLSRSSGSLPFSLSLSHSGILSLSLEEEGEAGTEGTQGVCTSARGSHAGSSLGASRIRHERGHQQGRPTAASTVSTGPELQSSAAVMAPAAPHTASPGCRPAAAELRARADAQRGGAAKSCGARTPQHRRVFSTGAGRGAARCRARWPARVSPCPRTLGNTLRRSERLSSTLRRSERRAIRRAILFAGPSERASERAERVQRSERASLYVWAKYGSSVCCVWARARARCAGSRPATETDRSTAVQCRAADRTTPGTLPAQDGVASRSSCLQVPLGPASMQAAGECVSMCRLVALPAPPAPVPASAAAPAPAPSPASAPAASSATW